MKNELFIQYLKYPEKLNQDSLPFLKELTERYPAFEAARLLYLKNLKNIASPLFGQELFHGAIYIQDRKKLFLFLNKSEERQGEAIAEEQDMNDDEIYKLIFPAEYKLEDNKHVEEAKTTESSPDNAPKPRKGNGLIEKFLEARPKMPKVTEQDTTPAVVNIPAEEEAPEDFVTETLARIYTQQGYYKKAIQIFEKLSLKYPEKSTYFAGQIEKVNNLINNKFD